MTKVKYIGDKKCCNVKAGAIRIKDWKKGEIKDICPIAARRLVYSADFVLANIKDLTKEVKKTAIKKEMNNFDFNNDGVVDEKDMSLAGKALALQRKKSNK